MIRRTDEQARADAPRELPEQGARELGVVIHHQDVWHAVARAECHLENDPRRVRRRVG